MTCNSFYLIILSDTFRFSRKINIHQCIKCSNRKKATKLNKSSDEAYFLHFHYCSMWPVQLSFDPLLLQKIACVRMSFPVNSHKTSSIDWNLRRNIIIIFHEHFCFIPMFNIDYLLYFLSIIRTLYLAYNSQ